MPSALCRGHFLSFYASFFHTIGKTKLEGGVLMEEDNDIYELFLEIMEQLQSEDPDRRIWTQY